MSPYWVGGAVLSVPLLVAWVRHEAEYALTSGAPNPVTGVTVLLVGALLTMVGAVVLLWLSCLFGLVAQRWSRVHHKNGPDVV